MCICLKTTIWLFWGQGLAFGEDRLATLPWQDSKYVIGRLRRLFGVREPFCLYIQTTSRDLYAKFFSTLWAMFLWRSFLFVCILFSLSLKRLAIFCNKANFLPCSGTCLESRLLSLNETEHWSWFLTILTTYENLYNYSAPLRRVVDAIYSKYSSR